MGGIIDAVLSWFRGHIHNKEFDKYLEISDMSIDRGDILLQTTMDMLTDFVDSGDFDMQLKLAKIGGRDDIRDADISNLNELYNIYLWWGEYSGRRKIICDDELNYDDIAKSVEKYDIESNNIIKVVALRRYIC